MLFLHLFVLTEIQLVYNNILISSVKLIQNFYILYSTYTYYGILPIFSVLYNITLQLIYFIHSTLCLLNTSLYFAPPSVSLLMFSLSLGMAFQKTGDLSMNSFKYHIFAHISEISIILSQQISIFYVIYCLMNMKQILCLFHVYFFQITSPFIVSKCMIGK